MPINILSSEHNRERVVRQLLGLFGLLAILYIYLINSFIFNAIDRQRKLDQVGTIQSTVVGLEKTEFDLSSKVTLDLAYQLGFKDADGATIFTGKVAESKLPSISYIH